LLKLSLAASGTVTDWDYGLNLGYQSYLESESGDDSDLFYGFYVGKEMSPFFTGLLEYSVYRHTHSEGSLEEEITDATALVGIKYQVSDNLQLGLGIGSGLSDSYADLRAQATLLWRPGQGEASQTSMTGETTPQQVFIPEAPRVLGADMLAGINPGRGGVLIQISDRSGKRGLGERVARFLEKAGYVVPIVEAGTGDKWEKSYIYYSSKNRIPATDIKLIFAQPDSLIRAASKLKGIGVLVVLGEDLADWRQ
jgi:hypothetical protein